ncbi:DUF2256 domain-containing protein [Stagnimonas aquatica]|uniref:DUF2256 domain-containing protein n=1 Tax=Stagnimonas aquatica TaxID=2689987 RepID=A0A3N0VLQ5_9GAMM|nr:DUF2256 domain-containing protein [Stagnimonas aquatica]
MPRGIAKSQLPSKICLHCGRPMVWRRKWEKVWEQLRYCSEACRAGRHPGRPGGAA